MKKGNFQLNDIQRGPWLYVLFIFVSFFVDATVKKPFCSYCSLFGLFFLCWGWKKMLIRNTEKKNWLNEWKLNTVHSIQATVHALKSRQFIHWIAANYSMFDCKLQLIYDTRTKNTELYSEKQRERDMNRDSWWHKQKWNPKKCYCITAMFYF